MMTNRHRSALYTGMTNHLERRVYQHKTKALPGYTSRYGVDCLVYFEETSDVLAAIAREKEIKGWTRARKIGDHRVPEPRVARLERNLVRPAFGF